MELEYTYAKFVSDVPEQRVMLVQRAQTFIRQVLIHAWMQEEQPDVYSGELLGIINYVVSSEPDKLERPVVENSLRYYVRSIWRQLQEVPRSKPKASPLAAAPDVRKAMDLQRVETVLITDYDREVLQAVNALCSMQPKVGRQSLRARAEVIVRFDAIAKDINELKGNGTKMVQISTHANCSKRCSYWQGKVFSLDGKTGKTSDGKPYVPIEVAMAGKDKSGNGLFGYNCRHRAFAYMPGAIPPTMYSVQEVNQERKVDSDMRAMERKLRALDDRRVTYKAMGRLEVASIFKKNWDTLFERYKAYSNDNERAWEEWRCRVI